MEVLHGIDGVLFFRKNEEWVVFGCAETVEVAVNTETISVKTIGDGQWNTTRAQKYSYTLSCSGVVQYDDEDNRQNAFDLLEYQVSGTHVEWHISFKQNDRTTEYTQLRGYALITNTTLSAPNDFVNCSLEMEGKGELLRGAPPTCSAAITDYDVDRRTAPSLIYDVSINTVTGTPTSYHWRLDGSAINTSLSADWHFSVGDFPGNPYGDHVLEIWPVCDNGIDGTKTTHNFTTTL